MPAIPSPVRPRELPLHDLHGCHLPGQLVCSYASSSPDWPEMDAIYQIGQVDEALRDLGGIFDENGIEAGDLQFANASLPGTCLARHCC